MYDLIMGRIPYLSGKNGDLLDDPNSLFFQELLKDAVADSTYPNDGEFSISGHDLYPLCVRFGGQSIICHPLLFVLLTSFSQVRVWVVVGSKWDHPPLSDSDPHRHLSPPHCHVFGGHVAAYGTKLICGLNPDSAPGRVDTGKLVHRSN